MFYIVSMDYSVFIVNFSGDICFGIDGFGNFVFEVFGVVGLLQVYKSVMNLYLVDSGDYFILFLKIRGYGWIYEMQFIWIKKMFKKLQVSVLSSVFCL